jgi:hypothetical protein
MTPPSSFGGLARQRIAPFLKIFTALNHSPHKQMAFVIVLSIGRMKPISFHEEAPPSSSGGLARRELRLFLLCLNRTNNNYYSFK